MSYFVAIDGEPVEDIATNSGWHDFARWAREFDYPALQSLVDEGFTEDLDGLKIDIEFALKNRDPSGSQKSIGEGFLSILEEHEGDILIVTDGFGDDEDEEGDDAPEEDDD